MNRRTQLLLLSSCLALSCSSGFRGVRTATAADLALPLEHRFVCATPNMMGVTDGKVTANWPKPNVQFRKGASGRVVIDSGKVVTNVWRDENGEHFFSYFGSGLGVETLIGKHKENGNEQVLQLMWAPQVGDTDAAVIETAADGTVRPRGVPTEIYSCTEESVAAINKDPKLVKELKWFRQLPLMVVGLDEVVPLSSRPELVPLQIQSCSREGKDGKYYPSQRGLEQGPDYAWVPQDVLVSKTTLKPAAISFGRRGVVGGDVPVFPFIGDAPLFFIGDARFEVLGVRDDKKRKLDTQVALHISTSWQGGPELWCYFGDGN